MNYDRFLDIHFVSSKVRPGARLLDDGTGRYQYDFKGDVNSQRRAYRDKLQGRFDAAIPRVVFANIFDTAQPFQRPRPKQANSLHMDHVIGEGPANWWAADVEQATTPLDSYHYVSCYVDLENLRPGMPVMPELQSLVEWVCAKQSPAGAPLAGKMRLNCHGSNSADAGLAMGDSSLSADNLVDALIRHGLGTRAMQNTVARRVASEPQATWKLDAKVQACENCKKEFTTFTRRKHHCRRCGGIFCDDCTKQRRTVRDPLVENGKMKGDVKDCRVCDRCAAIVTEGWMAKQGLRPAGVDTGVSVKAGKGLAQITLALCLTASSKKEFADAKTGFARNSIASKLVKRLSMKGIHGIQVSGSNEVVAWSGGGNLVQTFGLVYPGMSRNKKPTTGHADDPFEGTEWAGTQTVETSMTIPSLVLGARGEPNPAIPPIIDDAKFATIRDQRIVPVMGGNRMAFGRFPRNTPEAVLVEEAVRTWSFTSWRKTVETVASFPELTRQATDLSSIPGSDAAILVATRPRAAALQGVARPSSKEAVTFVFDAPQRRVTIRRHTLVPDTLIVTGFEERAYKDYKIYEVS
jgi:hypothetical protein